MSTKATVTLIIIFVAFLFIQIGISIGKAVNHIDQEVMNSKLQNCYKLVTGDIYDKK